VGRATTWGPPLAWGRLEHLLGVEALIPGQRFGGLLAERLVARIVVVLQHLVWHPGGQ
jgi:hypothetical protein